MLQKVEDCKLKVDGIFRYTNIIYVPNSQELRIVILREMHNVPYVGHPGYQKTVAVVKSYYFWPSMKKDIVEYIAKCMECQKVKADHRHAVGLLQPFPIPVWKWEVVKMDFMIGFPNTDKQHDSIMVVVDKLIPLKTTHKLANVVDIYMREVA
jgi:hypothetical protein